MTNPLSRRRFLFSLAASVVAVGAPLPIGFPKPEQRGLSYVVFEDFPLEDYRNVLPNYWIHASTQIGKKLFQIEVYKHEGPRLAITDESNNVRSAS